MTNKERIDKQVLETVEFYNSGKEIDWDRITLNPYESGRKVEVGDTPVFALIITEGEPGNMDMRLVKIHPDEYGVLYEDNELCKAEKYNNILPFLQFKSNG